MSGYDPYPWIDRTGDFSPAALFCPPGVDPASVVENGRYKAADLSRFDQHGARKRVCVLGGGIAGLVAAYELNLLDHDVVLLEASHRLGGRVLTTRFQDGTYGEFGAMRIPGAHATALSYVDKFQLARRPFVQYNSEGYLFFRGGPPERIANSEAAAGQYVGIRRHIAESLPWQVFGSLLEDAVTAARVDGASIWEVYEGQLTNALLQRLDRTSLWEYLQGDTTARGRGRLRPLLHAEEWAWVGGASGVHWLEKGSTLEHLVEAFSLLGADKWEVAGGMDRLIGAFAGALSGLTRISCKAEAIDVHEDGISVVWTSAQGQQRERFDYVICTLPAPSVAQLAFNPRLDSQSMEALRSISYDCGAKTVVHCRRRLWEADGIIGGSSFTDLPIQQCWYPSDHSEPRGDSDGPLTLIATHTGEPDPDDPTRARREVASFDWTRARGRAGDPGAFIAAYMWGTNAQRFATLDTAERDNLVLRSVVQIHPGIDREIDEIRHHSWDNEASPGGGAFAWFRPGELSRYQYHLYQPHPREAPRCFFAGEHVGVLHAWIQTSLQTALGAVVNIISA